ncbi:MAG: hypothetical protein JWR25_2056 [Noviherbaspirillum sp.]|nr:hypothetical protein [Noviherbaspirillum sp.]
MLEAIVKADNHIRPENLNQRHSTTPISASGKALFKRLALVRNQLTGRDSRIDGKPDGVTLPATSSTVMAELRMKLQSKLDEEVLIFELCRDSGRFAELSRQLDPDSVQFLKTEGSLWREKLMNKLTPAYAKLEEGTAVFCWFCHPKMYGGGFVTHLSAVVVAKTANGPEVMVFHHESIPLRQAGGAYQDGKTLGYLGIRVFGYDTRYWYRRIAGQLLELKDVPAVKSLLIGGFPSVKLSTVRNYEKGKNFAIQCLEISEQFWPDLYYAPHGSLQDTECTIFYPSPTGRVGKHFRQVNNCYLSTADLYTAMCGDDGVTFERYSIERMGDDLRKAGLLPRSTEKAFTDLLGEKPGPKTFFLYTSQAGVNPQGPDGFDVEGNLVAKLQEHAMTNEEYIRIMRNMRPRF